MNLHTTIPLKGNRKLGFLECGDPNGYPVLYFQGFPGSRLHALDFDMIAKQSGCHLIGVDRPGQGLSTFNQYTLSCWVNDIKTLLHQLNIDKVSIIAHSGGAPFALSCGIEPSNSETTKKIVATAASFATIHAQISPVVIITSDCIFFNYLGINQI